VHSPLSVSAKNSSPYIPDEPGAEATRAGPSGRHCRKLLDMSRTPNGFFVRRVCGYHALGAPSSAPNILVVCEPPDSQNAETRSASSAKMVLVVVAAYGGAAATRPCPVWPVLFGKGKNAQACRPEVLRSGRMHLRLPTVPGPKRPYFDGVLSYHSLPVSPSSAATRPPP